MRRRTLLRVVGAAAAGIVACPTRAQAGVEDTIARVRRSVVGVGTLRRSRAPAFQFLGSGFAVGDGTRIATNAHVLEGAKELAHDEQIVVLLPAAQPGAATTVTFRAARRVAEDRDADLAVLAIEPPALPALPLATSGDVREGRNVYFTGFPIGAVLGPIPVTHRAIVAAITPLAIPQGRAGDLNPALIRRLADGAFLVYQLDGTAYPGNSGSPVYDAQSGEVIAILNMVFVKTTKEAVLAQPSGIAYAVPVEHLSRLLVGARK